MLLPFLIGAILLVVLPLLTAIALALSAYDGLSAPTWRGLTNFQNLANDPLFLIAIRNSLVFTLITVPLRLLITLTLALLLRRPRPGVLIYRAAIYLPTVLPSVAYALIWLWVLNPYYGPLNLILASLGLPGVAWLTQSSTALPALAFSALFQIGEGFVVLLAGLREIPDDYYQAASLDGAGRLDMLRFITLPMLAPWLLLITIRDVIVSAQNTFAPTLIMTNGGPYYATLFLPLLIYRRAFDSFRFGEAAAITLSGLFMVTILIIITYKLLGGWGYEDEV